MKIRGGNCLPESKDLALEGNCFFHKGIEYCVEEVNGYMWLDRSLGATSVNGQGSWFFQYDRGDEEHQIATSSTLDYTALAANIKPINVFESQPAYEGRFVTNATNLYWIFPNIEMKHSWNNQRGHTSNNPCPMGYVVPTSQQLV